MILRAIDVDDAATRDEINDDEWMLYLHTISKSTGRKFDALCKKSIILKALTGLHASPNQEYTRASLRAKRENAMQHVY
jgi:hypothetical protein